MDFLENNLSNGNLNSTYKRTKKRTREIRGKYHPFIFNLNFYKTILKSYLHIHGKKALIKYPSGPKYFQIWSNNKKNPSFCTSSLNKITKRKGKNTKNKTTTENKH